jgi:hypothetical protein
MNLFFDTLCYIFMKENYIIRIFARKINTNCFISMSGHEEVNACESS